MAFKISGFGASQTKENNIAPNYEMHPQTEIPRKSLVQIRFPGKGMALTYYNDQFDLKPGDQVYVDGKMEGLLGQVMEVNYNFKIKISDYKKVIAVDVHAVQIAEGERRIIGTANDFLVFLFRGFEPQLGFV